MTEKDIARFWSKVKKSDSPDGCWEWTAGKSDDGYGGFKVRLNGVQKHCRAHRLSFELATGDKPNDFFVCHSCDNRGCVNPNHLWLGSNKDNIADAAKKGRMRNHKKLDEESVVEIRLMVASGCSRKVIAEKFGVGHPQLSSIVTRRAWKHVL